MSTWIGLGVGIGAIIGIVADNLTFGIGIGLGLAIVASAGSLLFSEREHR